MGVSKQINVLNLLVFLCFSGFLVTQVLAIGVVYEEDDKPVIKPNLSDASSDNGFEKFLCLDGGGLKGIIPTMVLIEFTIQLKTAILLYDHEAIEEQRNGKRVSTVKDFHVDMADTFNGIAGISAGSWIATYLASKGGNKASREILKLPHVVDKYGSIRPGSTTGLRVFFLEYAINIYPPRPIWLPKLVPRFTGLPLLKLRLIQTPLYPVEGLEWVLERFLGDTKLSEVSTGLLVIAFDLNQRTTIQFIGEKKGDKRRKNTLTNVIVTKSRSRDDSDLDSPTDEKDSSAKNASATPSKVSSGAVDALEGLDYYIRDLARASSAFPMIHPSKRLKPLNEIHNAFDLIDGAMVGNNPTFPALIWAANRNNSLVRFTKVAVLSLGTGFTTSSQLKQVEAGAAGWASPMVELLLGATPEYYQSLVDIWYYGVPLNKGVGNNQLLRVQPMAEADTERGAALAGLGTPETVTTLEKIGVITGIQYSDSISEFINKYLYPVQYNQTQHE